ISRRDSQPVDAQDALLVFDRFSFCIEILKAVAFPFARIAGLIVAHITQASFFRGGLGIGHDLELGDFFLFSAKLRGGSWHAINTREEQSEAASESQSLDLKLVT